MINEYGNTSQVKNTVYIPSGHETLPELASSERIDEFNKLNTPALKEQIINKDTPQLSAIGLSEFLSLDLPPRTNILSPWLPEQGLTMVYAERGVGKTFLCLAVAYAISIGGTLFADRWRAVVRKRVLYVDGEMPARTLQDRLSLIQKGVGQVEDQGFFKLITPDLQKSGIRDLSQIEGQMDLLPFIEEADVVVFDNISTLVRSGRENEAESWIPIQEFVLRLRRQGKSVIFVHHAAKGGQQRGSSKREDVLDSVIRLNRPKGYDPQQGAVFEVHFEKNRGFDGEDAAAFQVTMTVSDEEGLRWHVADLIRRDIDRVVELIEDEYTQRDIATELGCSVGKVNKLVKMAKMEGLLLHE